MYFTFCAVFTLTDVLLKMLTMTKKKQAIKTNDGNVYLAYIECNNKSCHLAFGKDKMPSFGSSHLKFQKYWVAGPLVMNFKLELFGFTRYNDRNGIQQRDCSGFWTAYAELPGNYIIWIRSMPEP